MSMATCNYAFKTKRNINDLMPPQAPPLGPFETLGLAILQGTCDIFQKSIKKLKSEVFHDKFNYVYKAC